MSDVNTEVIENLNGLVERRFRLEIRLNTVNQEFATEKAELEKLHDLELAEINAAIKEIDDEIWESVERDRSTLIQKGKQSFTTMAAKFQFRKSAAKTKVTDSDGVMQTARRLGVVRKIAEPAFRWKLSSAKFLDWLAKNGELREHFADFIEEPVDKESLSIAPNSNYTVFYDAKRISPPSISIKKS